MQVNLNTNKQNRGTMKHKIIFIIPILLLLTFAIVGCGQFVARKFGGTTEILLPLDQRLVNITWKESNIWILTKQVTKQDTIPPMTYTFHEYSLFGVMQGKVIVHEQGIINKRNINEH